MLVTIEPSVFSEKEIDEDPDFAETKESFITWNDAVDGKPTIIITQVVTNSYISIWSSDVLSRTLVTFRFLTVKL